MSALVRLSSRVRWLYGADKCARDFAVDLGGDGVRVEALAGQHFARVFGAIDAGGFDIDLLKARGCELLAIRGVLERSGDAADPRENALPYFGADFSAGDHVGNGEASPGFEHAEGFAQNLALVGR